MRLVRDIKGIFVPREKKNSSRKAEIRISEFEINSRK